MYALGLYGLITRLLLGPVFVYFYWRGRREPAYRQHWRERLGRLEGVVPDGIWIHAASVGEVELVAPLVDALRARYPKRPLLLTTMTPTGRARAGSRLGDGATIRYVPLDSPGATRRFIRAARPRLAVFAETELWPNLIAATTDAGVPLVLVNASISKRSAVRYGRAPLAGLVAFMLGRIAAIGAASAVHGERFRRLGASARRVTVTGDLKYDRAPMLSARRLRCPGWCATQRPVWVAASTHAGEESLLLAAFARVRQTYPDTLLVIAPRHPQRFDAVARLLEQQGVASVRRSEGEPVGSDTAVVLADTLGEVPMFYAAADIVFVGGSLRPGIGGHNVIEAAACARPLCVGPHIGDWQEIVDALVACGAAAICDTPKILAERVKNWLAEPACARAAGRAGAACAAARRGGLDRSLDLIDAVLEAEPLAYA